MTRAAEDCTTGPFLIVSQVSLVRNMLRVLLSSFECEIDEADGSDEAFQLASEKQYKLILLDVPQLTAAEITLARSLRDMGGYLHDVPILAMLPNVSSEVTREYHAAGVSGFIEKPVRKQSLTEAINRLLSFQTDSGQASGVPPAIPTTLEDFRARYLEDVEIELKLIAQYRASADELTARQLHDSVHKLAGASAAFGHADIGLLAAKIDQFMAEETAPTRQALDELQAGLKRVVAGR